MAETDKKTDMKFYSNQPYDIEMKIDNDDDLEEEEKDDEKDEKIMEHKKETAEEEVGADQEDYQEVKVSPVSKPLPKFDISKFETLPTTTEMKELLTMMKQFTPFEITLDTKLKPYIPSYLPAIGEVDAFLKINRPDGLPEELGLSIMDEPTTKGVDKYILEMELAETTKTKIDKFSVKSIQDAEKKPQEISDWISKINDLQKRKVPSSVSYSKKMPDIESLMQVWPDKEEAVLKELPFPDERLNISLDNYAKLVCNMMDIPVHKSEEKQSKSLIESLHVLFTVYSQFKENKHFQNQKEGNKDFQSMKF